MTSLKIEIHQGVGQPTNNQKLKPGEGKSVSAFLSSAVKKLNLPGTGSDYALFCTNPQQWLADGSPFSNLDTLIAALPREPIYKLKMKDQLVLVDGVYLLCNLTEPLQDFFEYCCFKLGVNPNEHRLTYRGAGLSSLVTN